MAAGLIILMLLMSVALLIWYVQTPAGKAYGIEQKKAKEVYKIENILGVLRKDLDNVTYCKDIPALLQRGSKYHRYNYGTIYNEALEILASNPDKTHLKTLCLALGRKHYAAFRPGNSPTIYDEQAIQNDIQVRSK